MVKLQAEKDLYDLLLKANTSKPKPEDVRALQAYFEKHPPATWNYGVAFLAIEEIYQTIGTPAMIESTKAAVAVMKRNFGYDEAPPIEQLLIDHIVLCWLTYSRAQGLESHEFYKSPVFKQREHRDKMVTAAHRRFLRAVESLAKVRKMKLPAIQVNIGEKQINVADL